jgi:hypothetical protein
MMALRVPYAVGLRGLSVNLSDLSRLRPAEGTLLGRCSQPAIGNLDEVM